MTPTTPEYALTSSDPGHLPPTLRSIRHIVDFLKWRFSLLPVGSFHWSPEAEDSPDQGDSEIFIGTDTPISTTIVGARPAITVARSQLAFQGVGIGDLAFNDLRTGAKAYMDLLPTTLVIYVLTRMPFVAERLAFFIAEQLWVLREEIIKTEPCILYLGAKPMLSPPSPAGVLVDAPTNEWSCVTMTMPLYLQHTASKYPLNRVILNKLNLKLTPE